MKNNLANKAIGMDSIDDGIEMADLSDIPVALIREDMVERGMMESDLVDYENITVIDKKEVAKEIEVFSTVFRM